ncbi:MAG: CoA transferase [Sphingopyxis sp.]|nr:CoA transferase [Sphingopyxis sp.]
MAARLNRGKGGRGVILGTGLGQAKGRGLTADADVVSENYKVGGLAKYGLDPTRLRADFPRLIVCSITGFGQTGPYAHRAGYDFIVQAMSGFMSLTGEPDGAPQKAGIAYADIFTGMYSTVAILAALRRRDVTSAGAHIDMALLDSQVSVLANQAANYLASGVSPKRMGNGHANVVPYQAFATADGQLVVAVGNDSQYRKLCAILGEPGWADDARFANNAVRLANRAELIPLLAAKIATWDAQPLSLALEAEGVPAGPINDLAGVFSDPQVIARGMRFRPDGAHIDGVASPIVIDGERMVAPTGAPPLAP